MDCFTPISFYFRFLLHEQSVYNTQCAYKPIHCRRIININFIWANGRVFVTKANTFNCFVFDICISFCQFFTLRFSRTIWWNVEQFHSRIEADLVKLIGRIIQNIRQMCKNSITMGINSLVLVVCTELCLFYILCAYMGLSHVNDEYTKWWCC